MSVDYPLPELRVTMDTHPRLAPGLGTLRIWRVHGDPQATSSSGNQILSMKA
jgi:hypothetical protein